MELLPNFCSAKIGQNSGPPAPVHSTNMQILEMCFSKNFISVQVSVYLDRKNHRFSVVSSETGTFK